MALLTATLTSATTILAEEAGYVGLISAVSSNTAIAVINPAAASGPSATFTIVGITPGVINVTVTDTNNQQVVLANIIVTAAAGTLSVYPTQLSFRDGQESSQVAVAQTGTPPFTVVAGNMAVAKAVVSGSIILVTPVAGGTTTITVLDANDNLGRISVSVLYTSASIQEVLVGALPNASTAPPSLLFNDLQIQESFPGIELSPQEVGGLWYDAPREVSGDLWLVCNATWSQTSLSWGFVNSAVDAWALKLGKDGSLTRYECVAGTTPFGWTPIWTFDGLGDFSGTIGTTLTLATQIAHMVTPIWNTTGGTAMRARVVNVTDTASPTASLLDDLQVAGVSKWSIRKDGFLVAGTVVADRIVDQSGAFPSLLSGPGIGITGTWPDQTISAAGVLSPQSQVQFIQASSDTHADPANPTVLATVTGTLPAVPAGATTWRVRARVRATCNLTTGFYLGLGATAPGASGIGDIATGGTTPHITGGSCVADNSAAADIINNKGIASCEYFATYAGGSSLSFTVLQTGASNMSGNHTTGIVEYIATAQ